MPTNNNPDLLYLMPRESLLFYEDSRLFGLLQAVCNYYSPRNDQPLWGSLLRAIAQEMSRLEYMYQYDIVSREPQYLTPPDIRRRFAKPLSVGRAFPQADQYDKGDFTGFSTLKNPVGYRDMLVDLLAAYREGAVVKSISDVIYAYTGKRILVEELYKEVGQGVYDQSDRNAVKVSVSVGGDNPLVDIQNLGQLQEIVQSLYGAIDLAKPAHVGLEFTTVFRENEQLSFSGIIDTLRIFFQQVEEPPLDPMLWIAPIFNMKHPKTTLASFGRHTTDNLTLAQWTALMAVPAVWAAGTTYKRGDLVSPSAGSYQMYRAVKKSTGQAPASSPAYWSLLPSPAVWQGYYPLESDVYVLGISQWSALTDFYTGRLIIDPNGNLELATTGGTSGSSVTFATAKGGITHDGGVTWLNLGTNYLTDPAKWIQVVGNSGIPTGEASNWSASQPMGLVAPRESLAWEIKKDTFAAYNMD